MKTVDVLVIGAGQAGLSAGHHLRRKGFISVDVSGPRDSAKGKGSSESPHLGRSFVILDSNLAPGGAWQHRWPSLTMKTVNGIYELPGSAVPELDPSMPSKDALPPYFAQYEEANHLQVHRPVQVTSVTREDDDPYGFLVVHAKRLEQDSPRVETWRARYVINATGTWTKPFWPSYPGQLSFKGQQLHVHDYLSAQDFVGKRVVIVGAGISAMQLLDEISQVAETLWVTRNDVTFSEGEFDEATRIAAIGGVEERVRQGYPPGSVISITGQYWTPWANAAQKRGVLNRHPMFTAIEANGVRMADGTFEPADVILWATGFRAAIDHLAPLKLRTEHGGLRASRSRALDEPRLFLIGYGPSQSTVGANRAGREAVRAITRELD